MWPTIALAALLAAPAANDDEARRLFELGDYPACEKVLRARIERTEPATPEHVQYLAQLSRALSFQDAHDEALATLESAIRLRDAPALHCLAIAILLRACRFPEIPPHAEAVLAADPQNPFARFARGIVLSKSGQYDDALRELAWGLKIPEARRDAHLELALVLAHMRRPEKALEHLLDILVEDPYDQEACYQASRQLLRIRTPASMEVAAHVTLYFEVLKKAHGPSSRDHHFQAGGHAALAALMRAARWERLGAYDRTITEVENAQALARADAAPFLYAAEFWARMGMFAEADASLARLEAASPSPGDEVSAQVETLRRALAAEKERLLAAGRAGTPREAALNQARAALAIVRWKDAEPSLVSLLARADAAGQSAFAGQVARLLLAREPRSIPALEYLVAWTTEPSLLVPHLHYLTRLVERLPHDRQRSDQLQAARRIFLGTIDGDPGRSQSR